MAKSADLCSKHRPARFDLLVGQEAAVRTLNALAKRKGGFPHCLMFSGPSGTGKTTASRIVAAALGTQERNMTLQVLNAGMEGGKEVIRDLETRLQYRPLAGGKVVFILEECHGLTPAAQEALLLCTEEPADWCYFIFCTTDPDKVKKTLRSRCTEVRFGPLSRADLVVLVNQISKREGFKPGDKLTESIVEAADGSARVAIKILEKVKDIPDKAARAAAVTAADTKKQSIELCRCLAKKDYRGAAAVLKTLDDDPEKVRHHVLAYAASMLLNGAPRGYTIIRAFQFNFYDSKRPGLVAACWEACQGK